jgi:hypothetical protein
MMMMTVVVSGLRFADKAERNDCQDAHADQDPLHQNTSLKIGRNCRASTTEARARLVSLQGSKLLARGKIFVKTAN